jgi:hypothetical protein
MPAYEVNDDLNIKEVFYYMAFFSFFIIELKGTILKESQVVL